MAELELGHYIIFGMAFAFILLTIIILWKSGADVAFPYTKKWRRLMYGHVSSKKRRFK
jgi:hypothetical protein